MKKLFSFFFIITLFLGGCTDASAYIDGTFIYDIYFAEWNKSLGDKAKIIIHKNEITVLFEKGNITGLKKGMLLDKGLIYKHSNGQWIIIDPEMPHDINSIDIGGCSGSHSVIDFKNKIYWMC